MSIRWIAVGPSSEGWLGIALNGGNSQEQCLKSHKDDVISCLDRPATRLVEVGGEGAVAAPVSVLSDSGGMPDITQQTPVDRLSGWARVAIAGFLAERPNWDGVICILSGGISHWVQISADEVVSFQGFLTGRLITALGGETVADAGAIGDSLSRPERIAAHLHSASLRGDGSVITGHLIGAEMAAARPYWLGQNVAVIAQGDAGVAYVAALNVQAVPVETCDLEAMRAKGLAAMAVKFGFDQG